MGSGDVTRRADAARKFLAASTLLEGEAGYEQVQAALAVLSGIAAADAVCGKVLGQRARGQDHREATSLLAQVNGAEDAVVALRTLVGQKDNAHYSAELVRSSAALQMARAAGQLVRFMEVTLERR
jgi:hypothetical protein